MVSSGGTGGSNVCIICGRPILNTQLPVHYLCMEKFLKEKYGERKKPS